MGSGPGRISYNARSNWPPSRDAEGPLGKILQFERKDDGTEPSLDVCLTKGDQRCRYLVAAVTGSTWETRYEGPGGAERQLVSRVEAREHKAQFELEIATRLSAGWTVEWHR